MMLHYFVLVGIYPLLCSGWVSNRAPDVGCRIKSRQQQNLLLHTQPKSNNMEHPKRPKAIIFDLDGCLWRPEMYELLYFSGGRGGPFRPNPADAGETMLTTGGEIVTLLGDVRHVMSELYSNTEWSFCKVGISSRTNQPDWARELLKKFTLNGSSTDGPYLWDVFCNGPIEIANDSKVKHFERISSNLGIAMEDMLFFDNESGNCREVASLGVTVVYCPDGVTRKAWEASLDVFPVDTGDVIGIDVLGYDTLDGASRMY